jgi:hypothetical protein
LSFLKQDKSKLEEKIPLKKAHLHNLYLEINLNESLKNQCQNLQLITDNFPQLFLINHELVKSIKVLLP